MAHLILTTGEQGSRQRIVSHMQYNHNIACSTNKSQYISCSTIVSHLTTHEQGQAGSHVAMQLLVISHLSHLVASRINEAVLSHLMLTKASHRISSYVTVQRHSSLTAPLLSLSDCRRNRFWESASGLSVTPLLSLFGRQFQGLVRLLC